MSIKITNAATEMPVIWLYGDIGSEFGGVTADDFRVALGEIDPKSPIELHIHTDGGDFNDSIAIHGLLARRQGERRVIVDGKAYSGGSVVAMAGTSVEMARGSWMMIHEARGSMRDATVKDLREGIERLSSINEQLVEIYLPRWKGTRKELVSALASDKWMRDDEAVKMGLADRVSDGMAIAAHVNTSVHCYRNVPKELIENAAAAFPRLKQAEEWIATSLAGES